MPLRYIIVSIPDVPWKLVWAVLSLMAGGIGAVGFALQPLFLQYFRSI